MVTGLSIRRACWADLAEVASVLDRAFSWPHAPCLDFLRMDPHLFHEGRIGDHILAVDGGRVVGVVGAYGMDVRMDGVRLRCAALGQVATLPEYRGRGVMGAMLAATTADLRRQGFDVSLLGGDRRRYGAHGWALGGIIVQYALVASYLPAPPDPATVRGVPHVELVQTIVRHREALRSTPLLPDFELSLLVQAKHHAAVRLRDSWVVHDARGERVYFADGDADDIALLFAHLLARPSGGAHARQLTVECADEASTLSRVCARYHHSVHRRPSCMWRVGRLAPLLARACEMSAHRVGAGSDVLSLVNRETGEAATVECREGRLSVRDGVEGAAHELDTRTLSELLFSPGPVEHILPDLRADSPLRSVLPIRAHHSWFYPF